MDCIYYFLIVMWALSGKQLLILKSSSSVMVWVAEGNDFRRPITHDNKSLALNCVVVEKKSHPKSD